MSITEEDIVAAVDDRHGVIQSPTKEEEDFLSQQKRDAYVTLVQQMEETEEIVAVVDHGPQETGRQLHLLWISLTN